MSRLLFLEFEIQTPALAAPNAYSGMLASLLPPGRLWRLTGSTLANLFAACADELGRFDARVKNLLDEDDPSTASELLPDYQRELAIGATSSNAELSAQVVARTVAQQGFRPIDFQNALAKPLALAPSSISVIERTPAQASAMGGVSEIYRFFIYRDPTQPGTYFLSSAQAIVDTIKPSHTIGTVIESVNFLCDDPHSLCDRDLLGA